jgi:hypothetical protein
MAQDKAKKTVSKDQYFEQYKIYVAGMERISDRRESANKQFLALNSAVVVLTGLILQHSSHHEKLFLIGVSVLGLIICAVSWFLLNSYKQLNTAKFEMIHSIERNLPLQLYEDEWKLLGKGNDRQKYFPFSHVERLVPLIFGVAYMLIIIYVMVWFKS